MLDGCPVVPNSVLALRGGGGDSDSVQVIHFKVIP
jgi:hypothetical protein